MKTALIAGITGQDGAYLARHLLAMGYKVVGTSRDAQNCDTRRLRRLGIVDSVALCSLAPNDFRSVFKTVSSVMPDEIYNLAGQTSVGLSFEQPVECMESIAGGTLNFLEVLRHINPDAKIFSAGSSECYGETRLCKADEKTAFNPKSPYGVAKAAAFWQVANYREAYGMFSCTGILANHESPLRPKRFVTRKIIDGVKQIKEGKSNFLKLGNIDIWRDWGWAPEYAKAMHAMLQQDVPKDYIIASGKTASLRDFTEIAFKTAGLNPSDHIILDESLKRPNELTYSSMNAALAQRELGWKAKIRLDGIVQRMLDDNIG